MATILNGVFTIFFFKILACPRLFHKKRRPFFLSAFNNKLHNKNKLFNPFKFYAAAVTVERGLLSRFFFDFNLCQNIPLI